MLLNKIKQLAAQVYPTVIENRRHLHAHPELSFCEYNTAEFVKEKLTQMGIAWTPVADTGVLAIIYGEKDSKRVIALRADMDALPITEENMVEYASKNKGVMHACGHDVHTASLLGTASILQQLKSEFGGTIKLLFQPAEELIPGGAGKMIRDGVLENPRPDMVIGQHVAPSIPVGKVGIRKGKFMASMDEIRITVRGKGGHGAQPHFNIDPVLITAHIIVALQQIVSRMANPSLPTVLSFGKVIANGGINIIPDEVYIEGTFRTLDETWRNEAHTRMKKIAEAIAESMGGHCEFDISKGYPFLENNEAVAAHVEAAALQYLGEDSMVDPGIWTAAEDFAYYTKEVDSCFYMLGTGNAEKNITSGLHTSTFDIDEQALQTSTGLMAYIALRHLQS